MFRSQRDHLWLLLSAIPILLWLTFRDPQGLASYGIYWILFGFLLFLRLAFWSFRRVLPPPPVPDRAVREMLDRCADEVTGEWTLVKFRPRVSLEEARAKVGSPRYTDEDRLRAFMLKFQLIASVRPDIAIFYSANRGLLLANAGIIKAAQARYGRWTLDTWYSLKGALARRGLAVHSLDDAQFLYGGPGSG